MTFIFFRGVAQPPTRYYWKSSPHTWAVYIKIKRVLFCFVLGPPIPPGGCHHVSSNNITTTGYTPFLWQVQLLYFNCFFDIFISHIYIYTHTYLLILIRFISTSSRDYDTVPFFQRTYVWISVATGPNMINHGFLWDRPWALETVDVTPTYPYSHGCLGWGCWMGEP